LARYQYLHACGLDVVDMHKNIGAAAIGRDEAISAIRVEEFDRPLGMPIERPPGPALPVAPTLAVRVSAATFDFPFGAVVKNSISFISRPRRATSEWVVHCEVNQRHMRRSHPTRETALKDACSQLLQGHAVNRIVGPNRTITAERVRDWCAKHRP
jgi:hypothetical protein